MIALPDSFGPSVRRAAAVFFGCIASLLALSFISATAWADPIIGPPPIPWTPASASGGYALYGAVIPNTPYCNNCTGTIPFSTSTDSISVNDTRGALGVSYTALGGSSPSVSMSSWAYSPLGDKSDWAASGITSGAQYSFVIVDPSGVVQGCGWNCSPNRIPVTVDISWDATADCGASGGGSYNCNGQLFFGDPYGTNFGTFSFQDTSGGNLPDTLTGAHTIQLTIPSNTWWVVRMNLDASTVGATNPIYGNNGPGSAWITESIDPTISIDPSWQGDPNTYIAYDTLNPPASVPEPSVAVLALLGATMMAAGAARNRRK